jgi:hypothetical protein
MCCMGLHRMREEREGKHVVIKYSLHLNLFFPRIFPVHPVVIVTTWFGGKCG